MTNVALVVQRFGSEVTGGAEAHAAQIAVRLKNQLKWNVSIYTTTAKDYTTWQPHYSEGRSEWNGIIINRFHPKMNRWPLFQRYYLRFCNLCKKIGLPIFIRLFFERLWFVAQGPWVPNLHRALEKNSANYDLIVFFTYLYYPTACAPKKLIEKAILVPTAHDEAAFYLATISKIFSNFGLVFANTSPEVDLIKTSHHLAKKPVVVGLGFEPAPKTAARSEFVSDCYLLYLGRICRGKNVHDLINSFVKYKGVHPHSELKLVLCGQVEVGFEVPLREDILTLGYVEDVKKWDLLKNARALINPSMHESLSMIVLEAFEAECPVVLNRKCPVFRFYADQISGIKTFSSTDELETLFLSFEQPKDCEENTLAESQKWVRKNYSWDNVISKYRNYNELMERT